MKHFLMITAMLLSVAVQAQDGNSYFEEGDYYNASRYYELEVEESPSKLLNLAKSYFALKQFDKAIAAVQQYKANYSDADITYANQFIELLQRDDDEVEKRMIPGINTDKDEYFPVITKDGSTLYFVGDSRPDGTGGEDIFQSSRKADGSWTSAEPFTVFNTDSHENLYAISQSNDAAILFGNYPGTFGGGDLFYSIKVDGAWTAPCNLGGTINTSDWEAQANLSSDGRFLIFSTTRSGGIGSHDLWVSELSDEGWSAPKNLGDIINTDQRENSPFLASDGKTMYFASNGHFGFGGLDLFVTKRLDDTWTNWSKPVNMGKYINTLDYDWFLSVPESGSRGYVTGTGGIATGGSDDIIEFILPPSMRPEALFHVKGHVTDDKNEHASVIIRYIDQTDGQEVAKTASSEIDGSYAVSIPSFRKYDVVIDMKGFLYYLTTLDLTDPSKYFEQKSFEEYLGEKYPMLVDSKGRINQNSTQFDTLLAAGPETDMIQNFEDFLQVAGNYKKESIEIDRLIRDARYQYLSYLENQREVVQDHQVTRIKVGAKFEIKNIFFDFGKATLTTDSKKELDKLYDIMDRSEIVIEFGGHSDNVGSDEANLRLSQERVNSVKQYIVEKGINDARMSAVGYGESLPIASNDTDEGRQKNRRVELKITSLRLQREGADEITGDEEFDGLQADGIAIAGNSLQVDLLEKFKLAAEKGGLPSGADCSNEAAVAITPTIGETNGNKIRSNNSSDWLSGGEINDLDDYVFKSFNPYLRTVNSPYGDHGGVGLRLVKESNLREINAAYYFKNPDVSNGVITADILYAIKLGMPANLHFGAEAGLLAVKTFDDSSGSVEEVVKGEYWVNVPVGLRYVLDIKGVKIGPDVFYSFGVLKSERINDFYDKTSYFKIGSNVRWKMFSGGVFYRTGNYSKGLSLRAGLSF